MVSNIIFNIHQEFYVIKSLEKFDNFRLVVQYNNLEFQFKSIIFSEYLETKNTFSLLNKKDKSDLDLILPTRDDTVEDFISFSNLVIEDSLFINKYTDFGNYYNPTLWQGTNHTRTQQRWIQGFFWLLNLINAYEQTEELVYLKKASEIVVIWDNFLQTKSSANNKMIWHDETTARRLFALIYAYGYLKILENHALTDLIKRHLREHAKKLAKEDFFTRNNNHGMFQSLSLYAYSIYNHWDNFSHVYHDLAITRIIDYFLYSFTNEGISKENTPSYHYMISMQLGNFIKASKDLEGLYMMEDLDDIFENSKYYSVNIVKPNNSIPPIVDNTPFNPDSSYRDFFKEIDISKYRKSTNICFKESGYAIMRSK
ncbi:MAG: hypothetical protein ACLFVR_09770 [Thiohalospira sp.]